MIERVALSKTKQVLFKARGETEECWFSRDSAESFVRRVEEAMQLALAPSASPPLLIAQAGGETCRESTYPKELLLRIVEDHSVDALTRASAAAALRFQLDPEERDRVRNIAATTASADLRLRFEELAAGIDPPADNELAHIHEVVALRRRREAR